VKSAALRLPCALLQPSVTDNSFALLNMRRAFEHRVESANQQHILYVVLLCIFLSSMKKDVVLKFLSMLLHVYVCTLLIWPEDIIFES